MYLYVFEWADNIDGCLYVEIIDGDMDRLYYVDSGIIVYPDNKQNESMLVIRRERTKDVFISSLDGGDVFYKTKDEKDLELDLYSNLESREMSEHLPMALASTNINKERRLGLDPSKSYEAIKEFNNSLTRMDDSKKIGRVKFGSDEVKKSLDSYIN